MTSKVKGQGRKLTWRTDRCWPISWERNVLETPKLVGRLSSPWAIMRTSFKVKVKVAMSCRAFDKCWPISRERKVPETPELVSRLRMSHVAGQHVACIRQHVDYLGIYNYYTFMSRLTVNLYHLYSATDGQQTGNNFIADNKQYVDGNRQHVACKRAQTCSPGVNAALGTWKNWYADRACAINCHGQWIWVLARGRGHTVSAASGGHAACFGTQGYFWFHSFSFIHVTSMLYKSWRFANVLF